MLRFPVLALAVLVSVAFGSESPVAVDKGSYAPSPPSPTPKEAAKILDVKPLIEAESAGLPLPTNDWWTSLLIEPMNCKLYSRPGIVSPTPRGVSFYYPLGFKENGNEMDEGVPLEVIAVDKPGTDAPISSIAMLRWGDWTLTTRLRAAAERYLDVTIGHGLPYVWVEAKSLDLRVGGDPGTLTDITGKPVTLPYTGDALVSVRGGRTFAIFAPPRTCFSASATTVQLPAGKPGKKTPAVSTNPGIDVAFAGPVHFLVAAILPDAAQAPVFQKYAYAVPRQSRMEWDYQRQAGEVATTWTVTTEALQGTNKDVLQGWMPHQWRTGHNSLALLDTSFTTHRGKLRLAPGASFHIAWPFTGVVPALPVPIVSKDQASPFEVERVNTMIADAADEYAKQPPAKRVGDDTYWGAKGLLKMTQIWSMAEQLKHPAAAQLRGYVKESLTDWFTWTPGETARYFCRYPAPWSGLVGMKTSFGSGAFTDNHFHYGYLVLAASMYAQYDRQWAADYGKMVQMVGKQYANWDRADKDFPFLRTFDPWGGHSYAGGSSSPGDGNNQESSSESMQAWAGLFLMGVALDDEKMIATGAMGYAIEGESVFQYWLDYPGWKKPADANHSPSYKAKNSIASVMRDRDIGYWTWFSGQAIHIYGIQFIPTWTWMQYLARDPAFITWQIEQMVKRQAKKDGATLLDIGDDWGVLAGIGAISFGDPQRITKLFAEAIVSHHKLATNKDAVIQYWIAHCYQSIGTPAAGYYTDLPASSVYRDSTGKMHVVGWNPAKTPVPVTVYKDGKELGKSSLPAETFTSIDSLPFLR